MHRSEAWTPWDQVKTIHISRVLKIGISFLNFLKLKVMINLVEESEFY